MLNVLYTLCNMFSASNVTCSRAHMTSRTEKNRGEFYARFFINAPLYCDLLVLSVEIALTCTQGHAHNVPFELSALSGQFLNSCMARDFPKTSCTEYIVRSILSSPPNHLLLV